MPSGVTKLALTACDVQSNGDIKVGSDKFEVMLNPASSNHQKGISYDQKTFGQVAPETKFSGVEAEEVSFDILLDGTGVVSPSGSDVKTQVARLSAIVYDYDGQEHEPNVVRLLWGSFIFFGRLRSMTIEHTLFKPAGDPLRAKVKLSFVGYTSKQEEALRANRSSPDLSHVVEVRTGDTLPLLCHRICGESGYYTAVARFNGLTHFRDLKPGTRIRFPPLGARGRAAPPAHRYGPHRAAPAHRTA